MDQRKQPPLKQGEKVLFIMAGAFVVLAIIGFIVMQVMSARSDKPLFAIKTHYDFSKEGLRGATLFREKGCTVCHRALREGTNMGRTADMDGIGSRRSFDWLLTFLHDPARVYKEELVDHRPGKDAGYVARMPDEELHAIARFLSELKADQGSAASPIPPKGESAFIDTMVDTWAPEEWKHKYRDLRDLYSRPARPSPTRGK
ncbi:MAG: cytochrome c [Zetaproteobacteria bacterium]|nr:MAG: cytochrome c [Zetaproteobacteria bacterium]